MAGRCAGGGRVVSLPVWKRPKKKKVLESAIENDCRDYAHARGWLSRKMNGLGFRSWPDRLFVPRKMKRRENPFVLSPFWVEFKRPGEEPTPDQARMIKDLRARGETVHVFDNKQDFIKAFDRHSTP